MNSRQRRATRGLGAAAVAVVLAAVSHTVGGGAAPAPLLLVAALALSWPLTTLAVGRRVRLAGQIAAVTGAQAVLHVVFAIAGSASMTIGAGMPAGMHSHETGALLAGTVTAASILPSIPMLAAHLLAAAGALVLLRHGEAALAVIADWFAVALALPVSVALPRPARLRALPARSAVAHTAPLLSPATRRGPPVLSR